MVPTLPPPPLPKAICTTGTKPHRCPSPKPEKQKFGSLRKGWGGHQEMDWMDLMTPWEAGCYPPTQPPTIAFTLTSDPLFRAEVPPGQPGSTSHR